MDVNRQAWTAQASLLVHAADRYVGLRSRALLRPEGRADCARRDRHRPRRPRRGRQPGPAHGGTPRVGAAAGRVAGGRARPRGAHAPRGGRARSRDDRARRRAASTGSWRASPTRRAARTRPSCACGWPGGRVPPRRDLEQEDVTLVPDRRTYQPGEVAKLLVVAPFAPAEGVLTLRRSGLVREERFTIAAGSETLTIPIEDGFTPNVQVQVDLVGAAPREAAANGRQTPARPAFASGRLSLDVPPRSRSLALAVDPARAGARPWRRDRARRCRSRTPRAPRPQTARRRSSWSTRPCSR